MELHEIKRLYTTKEMVTKLKRQPQEWKIFAHYTSDNKLTTGIYRELKKLTSQKNQ
jgi:hypothetical protein